jgi:hypothetical protein
MHDIEPFFNWEKHYVPNKDQRSPFYGVTYNTQEYENTIYGYYIHPYWDFIGSETLYVKVLYANYHENFVVIELMGEWNDTLHNDIMHLKRNVIDLMLHEGITRYIVIAENILNFHGLEDDYYEEWFEDVEDGWIAILNLREFVATEMSKYRLDNYLNYGGTLDIDNWRTMQPLQLFNLVQGFITRRLN